MTRLAAALLLAAAATAAQDVAPGGPGIVFVDGLELNDTVLESANDGKATLAHAKGDWTVPIANIASVRFGSADQTRVESFNLYLFNGDALRGTVTGEGETLKLDSAHVKRFQVSLDAVAAARFGRLLGSQVRYEEAFRDLLKSRQHMVLMRRGDKPFPIQARVLSIDGNTLKVLWKGSPQDVQLQKVYGFVRGREDAPEESAAVRARAHLSDGGSVTLDLASIDKDFIRGKGATVARSAVYRLEFTGENVGLLSDFEPISVEEVAQFGKARPWQRNKMVLGGPLRLRGRSHPRGIGVHSRSRIEFVLGRRWKQFFATCGIDDSAGPEGRAVFKVYGDGKLLKEVRCRRVDARPKALLLSVEGVDRLVLEADPDGSFTSDFCDWVEARVFNAEPMPAPPWEK